MKLYALTALLLAVAFATADASTDTIVPEGSAVMPDLDLAEIAHPFDTPSLRPNVVAHQFEPKAKKAAIADPPDNEAWNDKPPHYEIDYKEEKHEKKHEEKHEKPKECKKFCGSCAKACPVCKPAVEAAKCHAGCDEYERNGHKEEHHMHLKGHAKKAAKFAKNLKKKLEACQKKCNKMAGPTKACLKCAHSKPTCHKCKACHDGPIFMQLAAPTLDSVSAATPSLKKNVMAHEYEPEVKKQAIADPPDKEAFEPSKEAHEDCKQACAGGAEGPRDAASCRRCHDHHRKHDEKEEKKEDPCERPCGACAKACPICKPDEGKSKKCFAGCDAKMTAGHKKEEGLRVQKKYKAADEL